MDSLIVCSQVLITHVENDGQETRIPGLSPGPLEDALAQAKERNLNLVQITEQAGIGYVRIRNEAAKIAQLIAADLAASGSSNSSTVAAAAAAVDPIRLKDMQLHVFRDAVDAHFIDWKSKKIVSDLRKRHPVKIAVQLFASPESAVSKVREMCNAIQKEAETAGVPHHYNAIVATDKEFSITLTPVAMPKSDGVSIKDYIKHPTEKVWSDNISRMSNTLHRAGRSGTYVKDATLKPKNTGHTLYRKDKFGRRID